VWRLAGIGDVVCAIFNVIYDIDLCVEGVAQSIAKEAF
jgi:hypothetical protein